MYTEREFREKDFENKIERLRKKQRACYKAVEKLYNEVDNCEDPNTYTNIIYKINLKNILMERLIEHEKEYNLLIDELHDEAAEKE